MVGPLGDRVSPKRNADPYPDAALYEDAQALWQAAGQLGWAVKRLTTWRVPEALRAVPDPVLYVEALFGPTLAEQLGLRLLEPALDWLPRLPTQFCAGR